ncbi:MAG: helix-turn-helix domain-containing protein [Bacteroidales bacterium]|nr:helix-turn-helix domain-containing protein [Bacteroidales bacterium]
MKATFGEYLRKLRTEKGLTLTQLAAKLGLDSANLSKIENGKRDFDEKRIKLVAKEFNIDFDELHDEFFSELIAKKLYENNCSDKVLQLAEKKIKYLKEKNITQLEIKLS